MLMKGVKKCGLLSAFFIIFGLSLVVSSDTNALKHDYVGIPYGPIRIGCGSDSVGNNPCSTFNGTSFHIDFKGDSWNNSYSNLNVNYSSSYINTRFDTSTSKCNYSSLNPIFNFSQNNDSIYTGFGNPASVDFLQNSSTQSEIRCIRLDKTFGSNPPPSFEQSSLPFGLLSCDKSNGAICGGLWNTSEYISSQILPYSYSSSGFYLHSKAIDSNGIHYSNTFSFSDMFNSYIPTFSYLQIPLHDLSGYFYNSSNLYENRQFEWKAAFEFDGDFNWHPNINSNGSFFRIHIHGSNINNNGNWRDDYFDCSTNLIQIQGLTRLEYSCPVTLPTSYYSLTPSLEISGNDNYVWSTNDKWYFAYSFLVSDNDFTPGSSFNSNITGGGTKIGDAQNIIDSQIDDVVIDGANFSQSLIQLFGFSFLNPFAPLLQMFSNNNQCVQIPTLAGMIHSESTEVCPWFDSSVRNIATPVLSISSMMLIFGFAVRWLGSRSGNFIEDSDSHESGGISVGKRGRK